MKASRRFIDLSHTVYEGLVTYRGLPAPIIFAYLSRADSRASYAPGTEFYIGKIEMVANTGTYLDAPYHRYEEGRDLSQLPLSSMADLLGVVIRPDCRHGRAVDLSDLPREGLSGRAVLIQFDPGKSRYERNTRTGPLRASHVALAHRGANRRPLA